MRIQEEKAPPDGAELHNSFLLCGFSILAGIILAFLVSPDRTLFYLLGVLVFAYAILFLLSRRKIYRHFALVALGLGLGILRVLFLPDYSQELDRFLGQKIKLEGSVAGLPEEKNEQVQFVFQPDRAQAKILVTVPRYPQVHDGDRIVLMGKLRKPAENGTSTFNYELFLAKDGIYYELFLPEAEKLEQPPGGAVHFLNLLRGRLLGIFQVLPEPESSILAGIILGHKSGLSPEIKQAFTAAGISHILVLSGFNITLVASFVLFLLSKLPKKIAVIIASFAMIVFGFLAGGGAVVARAVAMSLLAWYAAFFGRLYDLNTALLATVLAIAGWNPRTLFFDLGFQLALAALLGIFFLAPSLSRLWPKNWPKALRDLFFATLAAELAITPLLWYFLEQITLAGFISNLIVIPLVSLLMVLGFIMLSAGLIYLPLSIIPALFAQTLLTVLVTIARFFAQLPFGTVALPRNGYLAFLFGLSLFILPFVFPPNKPESELLVQ